MSLWDIGGALLGGLIGGDDTETSSQKSPWAPAQPWLQSNINSGQTLQNFYQKNPFSQAQLNAYGNSAALTDNFRNTSGSLINQMNGMKQFDRANPEAKPTQFNFGGSDSGSSTGTDGSLGFTNPFGMNQQQSQQMQSLLQPRQSGDTAGGSYQGGGGNVNDMFHSLQGLINSPMGAQAASMMGKYGLLGNMTQPQSPFSLSYGDNYGTGGGWNGPPDAAQQQAMADQFARDFAGYETQGGSSSGGGYDGGYGSNSAGGSPDGYW